MSCEISYDLFTVYSSSIVRFIMTSTTTTTVYLVEYTYASSQEVFISLVLGRRIIMCVRINSIVSECTTTVWKYSAKSRVSHPIQEHRAPKTPSMYDVVGYDTSKTNYCC